MPARTFPSRHVCNDEVSVSMTTTGFPLMARMIGSAVLTRVKLHQLLEQ